MINSRNTVIRAKTESVAECVLDVWITLNKSNKHIVNQIK